MPMVETSVAVATPSTTAARITKGSVSAGKAMMKLLSTVDLVWRTTLLRSSLRLRYQTTRHSIMPSTALGTRPPMNNEVIDTLRSEEHTSELQSLMRISYAVFCLNNKMQG